MAFIPSKCDPALGKLVNDYLNTVGVQTPTVFNDAIDHETKITEISKHFASIMQLLGLDLSDDSLCETPKRVAKMFVNEIFWGLRPENFPKCTTVENKMHYDEMVIERNVNVQSNCEHHFVVIDGLATVGYIPNNVVLGLSKINRIVEYFSKRPQIQERLTEQIFHALTFILNTQDVAVVIDAKHYCVKGRGVEDVGSSTVTSKLGGRFISNPNARAEFMNLINR